MIGTSLGVAAFLMFLLFAVQMLVSLHATSRVEAAAYEAARLVAANGGEVPTLTSRSAAATQARQLLGQAGDHATFSWAGTTDQMVVLSVSASSPRFLPFDRELGLEHIERTVRIRTERLR